jgi:polar amino acid transport system substrate-binding protein
MSNRLWIVLAALLIASGVVSVVAQDGDAVGTLVPPTPVPTVPAAENDVLLGSSTVARLQTAGVLRVGVLYNEPPYAEYTIRGEIDGYEADLARAFAETWGLELEFVQVTRQSRFDALSRGDVDLLLASVVHERSLDASFEFSQIYRLERQAILVRSDSGIGSVYNLTNNRIGYVVGTPSEVALRDWMAESGLMLQMMPYLTLDQAYGALFGGEIDGLIGRETRLRRVSMMEPDAVTLLEPAILVEPYAVVMLRQDLPMRNLVNRTLQFLLQDKGIGVHSTIEDLHAAYFPGTEFPFDALPIYANVGSDKPTPAQVQSEIPFPQTYAAPRILNAGVVRVAGVVDPATLPVEAQLVAQVNRSLVEQIAVRWGVRVEYVSGDPIALVESGAADLAVGIEPDWDFSLRVDFSQPYLLHGHRLLIPANRDFQRFGDLRGRTVAVVRGDPGAQEAAEAWAQSINVGVRFFETTTDGVARTLLTERNADVVYGDSLLLLPHLRENASELELGPRWYSRRYLTFALPRNDIDFAHLVNYTLQEMERDQTAATLFAPLMPPDEERPVFGIVPGSAQYLGLTLGR